VVRDSVSLVTTLILRAWVVAFGMVVCLRALINEVLVPVKKKKKKKRSIGDSLDVRPAYQRGFLTLWLASVNQT
jgi:hypothetical protein